MEPESDFERVLRGYHPGQVQRYIDDLHERLASALDGLAEATTLHAQLVEAQAEIVRLRTVGRYLPAPDEVGDRITRIFALAEDQAAALRRRAESDAATIRARARAEAAPLLDVGLSTPGIGDQTRVDRPASNNGNGKGNGNGKVNGNGKGKRSKPSAAAKATRAHDRQHEPAQRDDRPHDRPQ